MWKLRHFSMEIGIAYDVRSSNNCTSPWGRAMSCWLAMLLTYIAPPEVKVREFHLTLAICLINLLFYFSGLNLGLCDAIALAKTISVHIKSQDNQFLFNYSTNRRARAIQVVEFASSTMSRLVRLKNSTFLRRWIVGFMVDRIGYLKSRIVWQLSGLGTNTPLSSNISSDKV